MHGEHIAVFINRFAFAMYMFKSWNRGFRQVLGIIEDGSASLDEVIAKIHYKSFKTPAKKQTGKVLQFSRKLDPITR